MLYRRAKTNPCGTPFLRRHNLLCVPLGGKGEAAVCHMTSSLSGSRRKSLKVRPQCHMVSQAAVKSTKTAQAFFFTKKLTSMS